MKLHILLLGANGMVGRNILEHPGAGKLELLTPSRIELNLFDYSAVVDFLSRHQPDMVIHAAGRVGGIQANIREPARYLVENLDIGRNIVWAARHTGITRLLNLGSSCMYPRSAINPLREEMILSGELEPTNEGYALAKIITARLCDYVSKETPGLRYKTLVPCNLYGPYDKFGPDNSHLIPSIIHKIHRAKTQGDDVIDIWGSGKARREFMYAGDMADCLLEAVVRFDELPQNMNVGTGFDHSINEYYTTIAKVMNWKGRFSHDHSQPEGMKQKLVSVEKQTTWGWFPKTHLYDGISKTYEHYLQEYKS